MSPDASVLTLAEPGVVERATFAEVSGRIDRLARVLKALDVQPGERIGTFAWNNQRHFELYFAIPCLGAVLHTLNIRLFAEQLSYIVNHAEDRVIFVDDSLVAVLEQLAPTFDTRRALRGDGRRRHRKPAQRPALRGADGAGRRRQLRLPRGRRAPSRRALLHERHDRQPQGRALLAPLDQPALDSATLVKDGLGLSRNDRVLAVVPMFHANAWGLPYGAALAGADLMLPDRFLAAEPLAGLIAAERPTLMGCVPTIFARSAALRRRARGGRPVLADQRDVRRLGGAAPVDARLRGAPRREHLPGVGDDRDESGGDVLAPARGRARRGLLGHARKAGTPAAVGRAAPGRRRRLGGRLGRRVHGRDRGPWAVDRGALLQRRVRTTRSSTRDGCARGTSPRSTPTASCRSPTAPRT